MSWEATDVQISFIPRGDAATRVEIEHSGWERLGGAGREWRERNTAGWRSLLPHFEEACDRAQTPGTVAPNDASRRR
jgi:hypothetical protein